MAYRIDISSYERLDIAAQYIFDRTPGKVNRLQDFYQLSRGDIYAITAIKHAEDLPEHAAADEKHTTLLGEKVYVATTVAKGCVLGASRAESAGVDESKEGLRHIQGGSPAG